MRRSLLSLALVLWLPLAGGAAGPVSPDGTPVQIDLPLAHRMRNVGGSDGAGLCVYTSVVHAALYQGESRLFGLRKFAEKRPGGSWPAKLAADLKTVAPDAPVIQVLNCDAAFVRRCLENGYLVSITWANGSHMLNCVHLDEKWGCVLDNNSPYGKDKDGNRTDTALTWMPAAELMRRAAGGSPVGCWAVVVLEKGPPAPIPCNALPGEGKAAAWAPPCYEWRYYVDDPGRLYLFAPEGKQVGCYEETPGRFRYLDPDTRQWSAPCPAPFALPAMPRPDGRTGWRRVFPAGVASGVSLEHLWHRPGPRNPTGPSFALNGKQIDRATAEALVSRYATALRLTVVGDAAMREQVRSDLATAPQLAPWRGKLCVQDYDPANPLARDMGLVPGLTLQLPPGPDGRGKVLHRQTSYTGPAKLAEALRRADPTYQPAKDPDLTQPPPAPPVPAPAPQPVVMPMTPDFPAGAVVGSLGTALLAVLGWLLTRLMGRVAPATPATPVVPATPAPSPVAPAPALPLLEGRPILDALLRRVLGIVSEHTEREQEAQLDRVARRLVAGLFDGDGEKKAA